MVKKIESVGKRFSKRTVEMHTTEFGEMLYQEQLDHDGYFSDDTVQRHLSLAVSVLEAEGLDVASLLADSPHGSGVRDFVLNRLDRAPDSRVALAALILEACLHLRAYMEMEGGERHACQQAYRIGRLTSLARVYALDSADHRKRRKDKPAAADACDPTRNSRMRAFYTRLVVAGEQGATLRTAEEFGVSVRTVQRIVKMEDAT